MGNCLRHRSQTTWGGDDWDFTGSEKLDHRGDSENVSLLGEKNEISSTEIKIKLTKKQMEELLAKVGMQGMSIEQVLTQLVNKGGDCRLRHRAWRPALQSIPEEVERDTADNLHTCKPTPREASSPAQRFLRYRVHTHF